MTSVLKTPPRPPESPSYKLTRKLESLIRSRVGTKKNYDAMISPQPDIALPW